MFVRAGENSPHQGERRGRKNAKARNRDGRQPLFFADNLGPTNRPSRCNSRCSRYNCDSACRGRIKTHERGLLITGALSPPNWLYLHTLSVKCHTDN